MNAIIYNGLTLNVSNLPVDDYWSFVINGAVELPGYFIVWPLLQWVGRRWTLALTMIICGVGCVSAMFMPEGRILFFAHSIGGIIEQFSSLT